MSRYSQKRLLTAGFLVFGGLFLARVMGFVREVIIASNFGTSEGADIVIFTLTLPDFMVNLLMGGALTAALIPELKKHNTENAHHLFLQSSLLVGFLFSLLVGVLVFFSNYLVYLFAPGFTEAAINLSSQLISYSLWVVPLTALAGVTTAYLQANDRFGIASLGPFIYNIILVIAFLVLINDLTQIYLLGWVVIFAGLLRWASQWKVAQQFRSQISFSTIWFINRPLLIRYVEALGAGGLLMMMPVLARTQASFGGPGSFATINYFTKLVELPVGIWLGVFSVVLLPALSELFARGNDDEAIYIARRGMLAIFIFSYSFVLVVFWFSEDLTRIVFEWGKMEDAALVEISVLLKVGIYSLPAQGLTLLIMAVSNARRDTKLPLISSLIGVLIFIPLSWMLFQILDLSGIILALVAAHWLILGIQLYLLRKRHDINLFPMEILKEYQKVLILGLVLFFPFAWVSHEFNAGRTASFFLAVFASIVVSGGTFLSIQQYREFILKKLKY